MFEPIRKSYWYIGEGFTWSNLLHTFLQRLLLRYPLKKMAGTLHHTTHNLSCWEFLVVFLMLDKTNTTWGWILVLFTQKSYTSMSYDLIMKRALTLPSFRSSDYSRPWWHSQSLSFQWQSTPWATAACQVWLHSPSNCLQPAKLGIFPVAEKKLSD